MRHAMRFGGRLLATLWAVAVTTTVSHPAGAQETSPALATALRAEHVPLAAGIKAASAVGKPISAKYEYEDSKLQLSVYTERAGAFSEVIVDYGSGKVTKTERITDAEDLKNAKAQSAAAAKAASPLTAPLEKALTANKGYSAVSVTSALQNGKPVAEITLVKGAEFKKLVERLE